MWKRYQTVLVSDAGGLFTTDDEPARDWGRGTLRVLHIIDSQVWALRKRITVDAFQNKQDLHKGFFISTSTRFSELLELVPDGQEPPELIPVDPEVTMELAQIKTRLTDMAAEQQELLVNWGYAAADAGYRICIDGTPPVGTLPYDRPLTRT